VVTKTKDLRTGRTLWESLPAPRVRHRRLVRNLDADVLIIGAGITGAMVADCLAEAGFKIVIVDKRGPAKGASTASTALIQHEIDTPLIHMSRKIGKANAIRAWRRSRLAVDAIAARLGELGISDVNRRDSLYLAGNLLDKDELKREHIARRAAGLASRYLDRKSLRGRYGIIRSAALQSYDDLVVNPRQVTLALLKAACARKTTISSPAEIVNIEASGRTVIATAKNGRSIRCLHLVFATGV
jgi:glycine/D-amino acid oxidase-like deaminating enzyme